MSIPAPLDLYRGQVEPGWIDYNGHMNVAYYVLAFDRAYDAFMDYVGLDDAHRDATGGSMFAAECHVAYKAELLQGDPIRVSTQVLGVDSKRLALFCSMYHAEEGYLAATYETLGLYVDLATRKVGLFPKTIRATLEAIRAAHVILGPPEGSGRAIKVPEPTTV